MPAFIKNLTVDCADALAVARFWAAALGSDVDEDSTPERAYVEAAAWGGPNDITVMRDPEGDEFCVDPGPGDPHPASGR